MTAFLFIIVLLALAVVVLIPNDRTFLEGAKVILIISFAIGLIGGFFIEIKNPGTFLAIGGFSKANAHHNEWMRWGGFFGFYLIPFFNVRLFVSLINLTMEQNKVQKRARNTKAEPLLKLRTRLSIDEMIEAISNWAESKENLTIEVSKNYDSKNDDNKIGKITIFYKEMTHYIRINEEGVLELRSMDYQRDTQVEPPEEIIDGIKEAIGYNQ